MKSLKINTKFYNVIEIPPNSTKNNNNIRNTKFEINLKFINMYFKFSPGKIFEYILNSSAL